MGVINHRLLITQVPVLEPQRTKFLTVLSEWKSSLPDNWQRLIIGPVMSIVNNDEWVVFLPDGSKEGWLDSKTGYGYAAEFCRIAHIAGYEYPEMTVELRWGDQEPSAGYGLGYGDDD